MLAVARKQTASKEILLWMTPSEAPQALQASECSELLDPLRASCWISAQHQPGKFTNIYHIAVQPSAHVVRMLPKCIARSVTAARTTAIPCNSHSSLASTESCWAEARIKIARMTLTVKLDGNWSSFQLANSAPPLSVTDSAIAPSARIQQHGRLCSSIAAGYFQLEVKARWLQSKIYDTYMKQAKQQRLSDFAANTERLNVGL